MARTEKTTVDQLVDRNVLDQSGDKIGSIKDVYADNHTGQPSWLAVSTGFFGTKVGFVPLDRAWKTGDDIFVPYSKDQVKDAPHVEADGQLTEAEEAELYRYYEGYGMTPTWNRDDDKTMNRDRDDDDRGRGEVIQEVPVANEEIDIEAAKKRQTSKVRLRKYVETEHKTITVPIQKERVVLEQDPDTTDRRA